MIKPIVKLVINVICAFAVLPWVGWARLGMFLGTESSFSSAACSLAPLAGLAGVVLRRAFYCMTLSSCHWDFTTHFGTVVSHPSTSIGRSVWIGGYSLIGRCSIEDDVIIGSRVSVLSGRHPHRFDDPDKPIREQGGEFVEVRMGRDCWIGEGSIVMADVGRGAVVGAGSVVVKPVSEFSIVAGNPARQIGTRGQSRVG